MPLLFRQLFDQGTGTYTYILADTATGQALIIDPVLGQIDRDLRIISELGLTLQYIFDTHVHADHVTGSGMLRNRTGARIIMSTGAGLEIDIPAWDKDVIRLGDTACTIRTTPGHTAGCASLLVEDMVFTGDALLIRKTGRTDFQWGSARDLYHSIMTKIYTLPEATRVFPGHDYTGQTMSTVGEERLWNTRIRSGTSEKEFMEALDLLRLEYPKYIDKALPANKMLGIHP